ncbi:uncharacterized protein LOC106641905 isoform X3 [Copidosoma floridanum]|uniref:uncharacterized protein LOC106641905 isoform X3 n=1 Tax=Copidosoma floridanum TaxID=29053 RepID=UPI0006C94288|nr:uncharacterized protein LOC106641905 isoform X3 [Copidosoma floridanum]
MNVDKILSGKIFVLGGDFRQLLPVRVGGTHSEVIDLCINRSNQWSQFIKYTLKHNMRARSEEIDFSSFLLNVGDGKLNDAYDNVSLAHFPDTCFAAHDEDIVEDMNADVNEINKKIVTLLDEATETICTSVDSTDNCDNSGFDDVLLPEYLSTLSPPSLPPRTLKLRENCIVMLIRNLNISEGLRNGTRLLLLELRSNVLKCEILTGDKTGEIVFLNRITLYSSETDYPFLFKR